MSPVKRPRLVHQQNDRTIGLRAIADEIEAAEWEDEEPTRPGVEPVVPPRERVPSIADATDVRAATFLERVLAAVSSWQKLLALALILGTALTAFYLWKALP